MADSDDDAGSGALEALDRFLEELRREFRANPEFAYRVVRALGAEVTFDGKDAAKLLNPRELVTTRPEEAARAVLGSLTLSELRTVAKHSNLATPVDLKGKDKDAVVDMIYRRAVAKADERQWAGGKSGG